MKSLYTLLPLFIILFFACKADKKTEPNEQFINSSYYVRYLEQEQSLKTEATFRQGDSLGNAQAKTYSAVFFNDQEMAFKKLSETNQRYVLSSPGPFPPGELIFSFINDKGHRESQLFFISPMKNLAVKGAVSKSKGASLSWEGEALGPQESVVCLFSNPDNKTTSTIINGPTDGPLLNIPPNKMTGLSTGQCDLYLVRKKRARKEEPKRSSFAIMEYYTATINIEVGE